MTTHNTASQNDFRALPATDPQSDPVMLRELQEELLSWAVQLYGARDESWRIDPPQFTNDGPQLDFAAKRGVFVKLAPNARQNWAFAVYQLAHESAHLLDPGYLGEATYLEEGVAVAFSHYVQPRYGINIVESKEPVGETYRRACALVSTLPRGHLESKRIRQAVGRLRDATADDLMNWFPDLAPEIAGMLASKFPVH